MNKSTPPRFTTALKYNWFRKLKRRLLKITPNANTRKRLKRSMFFCLSRGVECWMPFSKILFVMDTKLSATFVFIPGGTGFQEEMEKSTG
jgi:hypothetical protein